MAGNGGARPGSGRPKGSSAKPKITDYMSQEEIDEMVNLFISQCRGEKDLMKFLMEQIFGKAKTIIVGGDDGDEPVRITGINFVYPDGYNSTTNNKTDASV